eukprot:856433-Prymnesium_polylepis.1
MDELCAACRVLILLMLRFRECAKQRQVAKATYTRDFSQEMWATLILWAAAAVTAAATYVESEARVFYELSSASYCNGKGLAGWDCKPCLASKLSANNVSVYANEDDNMHAFTALLPADALGSVA